MKEFDPFQDPQAYQLFDYVKRIENSSYQHLALHVSLSSLKKENQKAPHLRVASSIFEKTKERYEGQMFYLANNDLFFVFKEATKQDLESECARMRTVFSSDPVMVHEAQTQAIFQFYDFQMDYGIIFSLCKSLVDQEEEMRRVNFLPTRQGAPQRPTPITPILLEKVKTSLLGSDLSNFVRYQSIGQLDGENQTIQTLFHELYLSIPDLQTQLCPNVDLQANNWLFQYFTSILDERVLSLLTRYVNITYTAPLNIHLHVNSLLSPAFHGFDKTLPGVSRGKVLIELKAPDIYADMHLFEFGRDFVRERAYKLCLSEIGCDMLPHVNRQKLGLDYLKLRWSPEMANFSPEAYETHRQLIKDQDPSKVILTKCDTQEAIDYAKAVGILIVQGKYFDELIKAVKKK